MQNIDKQLFANNTKTLVYFFTIINRIYLRIWFYCLPLPHDKHRKF